MAMAQETLTAMINNHYGADRGQMVEWLYDTIDTLLDFPSPGNTTSTSTPSVSLSDSLVILKLSGLARTLRRKGIENAMLYLAVTVVQAAMEATSPSSRSSSRVDYDMVNNTFADASTTSTTDDIEQHLRDVMAGESFGKISPSATNTDQRLTLLSCVWSTELSVVLEGGHELMVRAYITRGRLLLKMGNAKGMSVRPTTLPMPLPPDVPDILFR